MCCSVVSTSTVTCIWMEFSCDLLLWMQQLLAHIKATSSQTHADAWTHLLYPTPTSRWPPAAGADTKGKPWTALSQQILILILISLKRNFFKQLLSFWLSFRSSPLMFWLFYLTHLFQTHILTVCKEKPLWICCSKAPLDPGTVDQKL